MMNTVMPLLQMGRLAEAKALLEAHLAASPADVESRRLLGRLLLQMGNPADGIAHLTLVFETNPRLAELNFELGVMYLASNRVDEAVEAFRRELRWHPGHVGARFNLAWALRRSGRGEDALPLLQALVADVPEHGAAWFNLGNLLMERDRLAEAAEAFRRGLPHAADRASVLTNLGAALQRLGRLEDARDALESAVAMDPARCEAANNLGNVLTALGEAQAALAVYERALATRPGDMSLMCNLALALKSVRRLADAASVLERAIATDGTDARAWNCLGAVRTEQKRWGEAEQALRRAIALAPGMAEAHNNLGIVNGNCSRTTQALECFRRAHELAPDDAAIHSNLLFLVRHLPGLAPDEVFAAHAEYGQRQERLATPRPHPRPTAADADRRLAIGYVSPDLCEHAVALFLEPVLAAHDHERFEITCYHTHTFADAVTDRLMNLCDRWRNIAGMPPDAAADLIAQDRIDILVDLAGHSARNGLPIFARKAAPVQMTWLGYPGTTGLTRVDYRLTDPATDPTGENDAYSTEKLVPLSGNGGFRPPFDCPAVTPPPVLASGRPRFGSFNKPLKINDDVIALWCGILDALPEATLLMVVPGAEDSSVAAETRARFLAHGIAAERIEISPQLPLTEFLKLVGTVDVALDPFPYSGASTTLFSLWMGVPVVCMGGGDSASSTSRSILEGLGMDNLVASTPEEYGAIARTLVTDHGLLCRFRTSLRARMAPMVADRRDLAEAIEDVFGTVWRHHVQGTPLPWDAKPLPRADAAPMLAGHGTRLAVSVNEHGRSVIRLMDATGSRPVEGLFGGEQVTPRFSPDGTRLAFAEHDGQAFQIAILDLASGTVTPITSGPLNHLMPSWDQAGRMLTWHAVDVVDMEHANAAEIFYWDGAGAPRRMTANDRMDLYPVFAGDGSGIVYESGRADELFGLFRVSWDGKEVPIVHEPSASGNGIPEAIGGRIVFERSDCGTGRYFVAATDIAGTRVTRLSEWDVAANPSPRVSPDGKWIAAHGPGPERNSMAIHVIPLEGGGQARSHGGVGDMLFLPRWSADGRLIAAEDRRKRTMVLIDARGEVGEFTDCGRIRGQRFMEVWNFDLH